MSLSVKPGKKNMRIWLSNIFPFGNLYPDLCKWTSVQWIFSFLLQWMLEVWIIIYACMYSGNNHSFSLYYCYPTSNNFGNVFF